MQIQFTQLLLVLVRLVFCGQQERQFKVLTLPLVVMQLPQ
jgi:hypothetical protein